MEFNKKVITVLNRTYAPPWGGVLIIFSFGIFGLLAILEGYTIIASILFFLSLSGMIPIVEALRTASVKKGFTQDEKNIFDTAVKHYKKEDRAKERNKWAQDLNDLSRENTKLKNELASVKNLLALIKDETRLKQEIQAVSNNIPVYETKLSDLLAEKEGSAKELKALQLKYSEAFKYLISEDTPAPKPA